MFGRSHPFVLLAAALLLPLSAQAQDDQLRVAAAVQSRSVYVGQQFLLQLQVQGTDRPDPVDVRPLERDFVVTEAGGGASNSTSVTIVDGRMARQVRRGYNFNYRLAARKPGEAVIPPLSVTSAGRSASTQPLRLLVLPPQENDDFRLRLSLSESRAYVGQPVTLTVVWYIGREVQEFSFTMPLLDDRRFEVLDPPGGARDASHPDVMEIRLGDRRAIAHRGVGELGGRQYTVLRFEKVLVPRVAGSMTVPEGTVTFASPRPGPSRRRDPFDDFFGGSLFSEAFGRRELETLAIPSNRPRIEVLDLPAEGRPAGFNGWIGDFRLQAKAEPTSVEVGEPITLGLTVEGDGALHDAQFPALHEVPELSRDFSVPSEIGAGESREGGKVFTQTLRARHDRVAEIPPIELPYFDPGAGEYRIARSQPIALVVAPSRIVTAEDAEGLGVSAPRQLEVESREQGIAHNYVDASALRPMSGGWAAHLRPLGPLPVALSVLAVPPLLLLAMQAARAAPGALRPIRLFVRSRRSRWKRPLARIDAEGGGPGEVAEAVLAALRDYLGHRIGAAGTEAAAWTFGDVERRLAALDPDGSRGLADAATLGALGDVFERCEAGTYAGAGPADATGRRRLVEDAAAVMDRLEEGWS